MYSIKTGVLIEVYIVHNEYCIVALWIKLLVSTQNITMS